MHPLPAPFVPAGVDLRHFPSMSLDVVRLRDSRFAATVSAEAFRCGVLLLAAAWHQVPAGSLPDDDVELSALAGFGRARAMWRENRDEALYGWVRCSDGRLYHRVLAEKAVEAWNSSLFHRWRKEADRLRKENKVRAESGLPPLEIPARPPEILVGTPIPGGPQERDVGHGEGCRVPETPGPTPEAPERGRLDGTDQANAGPGEVDEPSPEPVPAENRDLSGGNPEESALNRTERNGISLSCPKRAAPVRTRKRNSEDFERWWSAYPTDPLMSKSEAAKAWAKLGEEDRAAAFAAIPGFLAHCRAKPDYRPLHAVRFLTQRRFDGYANAAPPGAHLSLVDEPRVDFGSGVSASERVVLEVLRRGEWLDGWGPKIGRPGCRLPQRILDAVAGAAA